MKKIFYGLMFQLMLVSSVQAATYYSSPLGYWCLARNGKSFCFRNLPVHNVNDFFIVDREVNLKGDVKMLGTLIIEEKGVLNVVGDGSLEVEGSLVVHFAGILNVKKNLVFKPQSLVDVDRYGAVNVEGDFINESISGDIKIDGRLEVMGSFNNEGIVNGLGKVVTPGICVENPEALTFGEPGCAGINMFTLSTSELSVEASILENQIILKWEAVQDYNFGSYQVQRSEDGHDFRNLGQVKVTGQHELNTYTFVDPMPNIGKNIYRLKYLGNNDIEYVGAIVVQYTPTVPQSFSIYPNPLVGHQLQISLNFLPGENAFFSLINSQGKLIMKKAISSFQEAIQIGNLTGPGIYIVLIENQGRKIQQRLVVLD